jgi:hypothetical protein
MRRQILYGRRFVLIGKIKAAMTGHTEPTTAKRTHMFPPASFRGVRQIASLDL